MKNRLIRTPSGEKDGSRWCSGLAYEPVTLMTRVRIPTGTPGTNNEIVLPSSCLFRINGPVAQHGRASGFYPLGSGSSRPSERNQVAVGPNPTGPACFRPKKTMRGNKDFASVPVGSAATTLFPRLDSEKSLTELVRLGDARINSRPTAVGHFISQTQQFAVHFQRKNISEGMI
jgi:hypothetical protein